MTAWEGWGTGQEGGGLHTSFSLSFPLSPSVGQFVNAIFRPTRRPRSGSGQYPPRPLSTRLFQRAPSTAIGRLKAGEAFHGSTNVRLVELHGSFFTPTFTSVTTIISFVSSTYMIGSQRLAFIAGTRKRSLDIHWFPWSICRPGHNAAGGTPRGKLTSENSCPKF